MIVRVSNTSSLLDNGASADNGMSVKTSQCYLNLLQSAMNLTFIIQRIKSGTFHLYVIRAQNGFKKHTQ